MSSAVSEKIALPPEPMTLVLGDDFEFHLAEEGKTVKEQVLEVVNKAKDSVTPSQLFEKKIGSNTSVYEALKELVADGEIMKEGRGAYKKKEVTIP